MRLCYLADAPYIHTRRWVEHFAARGWETHVISFRPADIAGSQSTENGITNGMDQDIGIRVPR